MTVTLRPPAWMNPQWGSIWFGTVPQTGVLMVTHERNMRSKFR